MQLSNSVAIADTARFLAAVATAERRALHSYFDQHILEEEDGYVAIDEGDYNNLPHRLVDRIVHTVRGGMADEY